MKADSMGTDEKRSAILSFGWRQGASMHYPDIAEHLSTQTQTIKSPSKKYLVVISQDCDIACGDFGSEPLIECLVGERLTPKKVNSRHFNCWNPRKLHIEMGEHYYEFKAKDICFLSKADIIEHALEPGNPILSNAELNDEQIGGKLAQLKQWKANRYIRTGLPEKFAEKTRAIFESNSLIESLKEYESKIETLYLRLSPNAETVNGEYSVGIIALKKDHTPDEHVDFDLENLIVEQLLAPLKVVDGISVDNTFDDNDGSFEDEDLTTIMGKNDFPIALEESFIPYYYDPISMEAEEEDS